MTSMSRIELLIRELQGRVASLSGGAGSPSGVAGGVLGGTYPNPAFAIDMATQAELDALVRGHGIRDEGVDLAQRQMLDFQGAGVTATDDGTNNKTIVTVPGSSGGASGYYVHDQAAPATTWTISHALGTHPAIHVEDSGGTVLLAEVHHTSNSQAEVIFTQTVGGKAYALGSTMTYYLNQSTAASTWTATHNLNRHPAIHVENTGGTEVLTRLHHTNANQAEALFSAAMAGALYAN